MPNILILETIFSLEFKFKVILSISLRVRRTQTSMLLSLIHFKISNHAIHEAQTLLDRISEVLRAFIKNL